MSDYQKYLKYKNKYLELKKMTEMQNGGGKDDDRKKINPSAPVGKVGNNSPAVVKAKKKPNKSISHNSNNLSATFMDVEEVQPSRVVFSYQGAFAPPHLGHYQCADMFIKFLIRRYPGYEINFMFMPTPHTASKKSLSLTNREANKSDYISEIERTNLLNIYARELSKKYPDVNVTCSDIEFQIGRREHMEIIPKKDYLSATINTLTVLRAENPGAIIGLGVGIDNAHEFSTWSMIDKYTSEPVKLDLILMCDRVPSQSAPVISATDLAYTIDISNKKTPGLEAFNTENIMYFKIPTPPAVLDKENFDKLVEKMVVLDAPVGYSSSEVRSLMKKYYQDTKENKDTTETLSSLNTICGESLIEYIIENNIFNPERTY
jgi:nicotinic acid mononucleotide adenylyltransferase